MKQKVIQTIFSIKPSLFTELCGWYGLVALITAYGLAGFGFMPANGMPYHVLNLTGSIGILIVAASKNVIQSVILNFFWATLGLVALIGIFT